MPTAKTSSSPAKKKAPAKRASSRPATRATRPVVANRQPIASVSVQDRALALRNWREQHNPVRGLNMQRAVTLVESYPRGAYADLMWTFGAPFTGIENADPDLSAILTRRTAILEEMAHQSIEESGDQVDPGLARDQAAAIDDLIGGIDNIYEAVAHLELALNRGFAHCEIQYGPDNTVRRLEPVDQWNVVRDGLYGPWKYNPDARQTTYDTLPDDYRLDPARFVIREMVRPLGRIALVKFIRANLSEKDWDSFLEIYGMPSGVVVMPADVPPERELEYQTAAQSIAEGGAGALPHTAEYHPNPAVGDKGTDVYGTRLEHLSEKLVLAGTGGKLTMLAESGSGTLAGSAHQEAFDQLGRADARAISELIQRQLIEPRLRQLYPDRPIVARWELAFREEVDSSQVIEDVVALANAGYQVDPAEIEEKTGYTITLRDVGGQDAVARPLRGLAGGGNGENPNPDTPEPPSASESLSARPLDNREKPKIRQRVANLWRRLTNAEPDPADDPDDPIAAWLAQASRGSLAAWEQILAESLADGALDLEAPDPVDPST